MTFLAFEIGCIECGEESRIIGVYETREAAQAACDEAHDEHERNWIGQRYQRVFELAAVSR